NQNYPNPFNPTTTISYSLPTASHVTLTVYNLTGQEVATLVDGQKSAGQYEVVFDASILPSGIYFYNLQTDEFNQIRHMQLVR
ncbi:peptidase S8, partial [Candidatus Kuenenbacteria bacterium CG10_big_fil_rev_8_21_14_0_10_36_11]